MVTYSFSNIFSCIKNKGVIFQGTEGQNKRLLAYFCVTVQQFEEEVILYSGNYSSSSWTQVITHIITKSLIFLRIFMSGCYSRDFKHLLFLIGQIKLGERKLHTSTQKKVVMGLFLWMSSWAVLHYPAERWEASAGVSLNSEKWLEHFWVCQGWL